MPKPVCVKCERFMHPQRNGFYWIEGMPKPGFTRAKPGLLQPEGWQPYKLWVGDLWHCPTCETEIVIGGSAGCISEHYKPDFAEAIARFNATLLVKDC